MPALDGLRAAAVVAVLLYHGDVAAPAGVVAGHRGAVLRRVAAGLPAAVAPDARLSPRPARDHDGDRRRIGAAHGDTLHTWSRPVARLLRHRHARAVAPDRRGAPPAPRPPASRDGAERAAAS